MASIELAGRRVGQTISTGAGHLALFYTDDLGAEFVLSAYTDETLFSGDLYVETYAGSAWVPRQFSTENAIDAGLFDRVSLDLEGRDAASVALLMDQFALALNTQSLDYAVFEQNSNSVVGSVLDLVGIDVDDALPNPSGVGWLGFVARNNLIEFDYDIEGSATSDVLRGRGSSQRFFGNEGDDHLMGGSDDDTLSGGQGDDLLEGGTGTDTAEFSGPQARYTVTLTPTTISVFDRDADGDGTDMLSDVEFLDFDTNLIDAAFKLTAFSGVTTLEANTLEDFIELYIAYFNRAPDAIGLNFWGSAHANGLSLDATAAEFITQDETLAIYPVGTSNEAFTTAIYNNVLGRAPDQSGLDFWTGQLDGQLVSRDQLILQVLQGAKSELRPELGQDFVIQQITDQVFLDTKTDVGAYFAVHKGMSDVDNARAAMALYDGTIAGLDAAVAAVDEYHLDALDPANGEFLMPLIGVLDDPFA